MSAWFARILPPQRDMGETRASHALALAKEDLKMRRILTLITLILTGLAMTAAPAVASVVNIH